MYVMASIFSCGRRFVMLMPATPHRHLALYLAVEDESARSAPCTDASRAEKVKVTLRGRKIRTARLDERLVAAVTAHGRPDSR